MENLKIIFSMVFILTLLAGQFPYPNPCRASVQESVLINEIAWMGTTASFNDEWIELYNATGQVIDLEGWTLNAVDGTPAVKLSGKIEGKGFYLLERSGDEPVRGVVADLIYYGVLGNNGEKMELRDADGELVDVIEAEAGWPGGDNVTKATLEREDSGSWSTSLAANGTPGSANSISGQDSCSGSACENSIEDDDGSLITDTTDFKLATGSVLINEFVADPEAGDVEWIELYNTTDQEIDMENWTIEDGKWSTTTLSGILGTQGGGRFMVVESPKGRLNNSGDLIMLRDSMGGLIDSVAYGNWDDGDKDDNAEAPEDGAAAARITDGADLTDDAADFAVTLTPTKGESNLITLSSQNSASLPVGGSEEASYDYSSDIIISEIFPNPEGDDSEGEFIELYNMGDRDVNLTGWALENQTNKRYGIKSSEDVSSVIPGVIKARTYCLIFRKNSGIVLNNTAGSVKLFQPLANLPLMEVKYANAKEKLSYALNKIEDMKTRGRSFIQSVENWEWTTEITPGYPNVIIRTNDPPKAAFSVGDIIRAGVPTTFDASESIDPEGRELHFDWDFGDGTKNSLPAPEHTFLKPGKYTVKLAVSDGVNSVKVEKKVQVKEAPGAKIPESVPEPAAAASSKDVVINEILPNPMGDDAQNEWIELKNTGKSRINLSGWKITEGAGGKKQYVFLKDSWIEPAGFLLVKRKASGLTLNNAEDTISLYGSDGKLVSQVKYSGAKESKSYARAKDGKWFWSDSLSPGKENVVVTANSVKKSVKKTTAKKKIPVVENYTLVDLEKSGDLKSGSKVIVRGSVAVEPGVLGSQYFYIVGSPGIQIYSYQKSFPGLKLGDYIEVRGEVSEANGEKRVKISGRQQIKILDHRNPPDPSPFTCEELGEESAIRLVSLEGEITKKQGSILYFDDGTQEATIHIKKNTQIDIKALKPGDNIKVTGIAGQYKAEKRIYPRFKGDIIKIAIAKEENGEVLGESEQNSQWEIVKRDKKLEFLAYLLIIMLGAITILALRLFKKKNR